MYPTRLTKPAFQKKTFIGLMIILILWIAGQTTSQVTASAYHSSIIADGVLASAIVAEPATEGVATFSSLDPMTQETEAEQGWFIVDGESRWTAQEMGAVQQIMDHTWAALAEVGLNGHQLLVGYRFARVQAEFVPGEERRLAIVDHQKMEIVLADGAFERLHGFYIYHELGHAVDYRLGRLPSEGYHRIAAAQTGDKPAKSSSTWVTADGFWLRYPGRDDREEATADAFAWWVMDQAGEPQPFFPGTPVATDYTEIAQTIEDALRVATAITRS